MQRDLNSPFIGEFLFARHMHEKGHRFRYPIMRKPPIDFLAAEAEVTYSSQVTLLTIPQ